MLPINTSLAYLTDQKEGTAKSLCPHRRTVAEKKTVSIEQFICQSVLAAFNRELCRVWPLGGFHGYCSRRGDDVSELSALVLMNANSGRSSFFMVEQTSQKTANITKGAPICIQMVFHSVRSDKARNCV